MRLVRVALVCLPSLFFGCPEPVSDPCENVNCGAGRCIPTNGQASCLCDTTYVAQGLSCVPATSTDACASNPCASSGKTCSTLNGQAICSCPSGYVDTGSGCVKQNPCNPDPCTAANQSCQSVNGAAVCVCDPGYTPVGTGCSTDPVYDCSRQHSGSAADDQYEPNECPTLSTAYDLTGSAQTHTIAPAGDEDWIRISPTEGHIIGLDFSGSSIPLYVDVYAEDGVTPLASDHRGVNTPSFRFLAQSNQLHYVRVRALRANDTGSYTLTITDAGPDDFTNVDANALSIAAGGTFSGEVQYTGDIDVVRVPVQATHTYRLLINATTTATGVVVEVVGTDGSTVRKTLEKSLAANQSHTVRPTVDGEILLRAKSETTGTVGLYSVTISDYGVDDHGDLLVDATAVTPSATSQSGMFETRPTGAPLDLDVFTFQAVQGHIYSFTCSSGLYNYSCVVSLRDGSGTVLASLSGGSSSASAKTVTYEALTAGTLNVTISPYSSSTSYVGAVSYKLEDLGADDYGDDRANASPITLGTPKTGRIESTGDLDYFSFTATGTHIYQVGCTPDTTLAYCSLRVLDASGLQVASATTAGTTSFEAAASGTYYVEAKAYYSGYVGSYTLSVNDVGTDDHGDTATTATALTLGTAKAGNIEMGGDVDFFSISATANQIYSIQCTSSSSYLCYLTVRDPGGATISTTSYGTSITTGFRALVTGTYTVSVRGAYSTDVGSYSITATSTGADDHSDTATGATALTLGAQATNGNIQFAGDKDVFSFSATTGHIYRASCNTTTTYLCVLTVKNPSGTSVATSSYGSATSAVFEAALTGTFTVEVSSYSTSYTGTYTIAVADQGLEDHGDTAATATALTLGTATAGNIELGGDVDFFSISATANQIYSVQCTSSSYYLCYMTVRDPNGTTLTTTSYGTAVTTGFRALVTGTYTVSVRGYYSTDVGSYSITATNTGADDHSDTATGATALTLGATATNGNIQFSNDKDVFSFSATTGRIYRATCTTSASYLCVLTVKNPSGTSVATSSYGTTTNAVFEAAVTGTFTVEVSSYSTSYTGAYTIAATDEGVEDHGDTTATATAITPSSTATNAKIELSGDIDVFSFSATAGNIYKFSCTTSASYLCYLFAKNSAGTTITSSYYGTATNVSFVAPTSGTYFVEVRTYYTGYTGNYAFQLTDEGPDDHGDTAATSTTLVTVPGSATGNIQHSTDKDVVKFDATSGRLYKFACTGSDAYGCRMVVRDAVGTSLGTSTYGTSVTYYVRATSSGTFSVELSNYNAANGSWSLNISETTDDHGDTPATATNISTGVAVSGQLELAADYDYFAVTLNANQTYSFAIGSSPTIYAYYRVENAAGTVVLTEAYSPATRSYTPTAAGTYYVRVRPYSASYLGSYTLTVQ